MTRFPHVAVFVVVVGCGGGTSPVGSGPGGPRLAAKLVELEITQDNGSITVDRLDLDYDGDRLVEIAQFRDGAPAGTSRFTYVADGIAMIDYVDGEGDRGTEKMTYRDHALATDRFEVTGVVTWVNEISYDASGLPTKLSGKTTLADGTVTIDVAQIEYDDRDRTAKWVQDNDGETTTAEYDYTEDDLLDRTTTFATAGVVTNEFVYSEGLLVAVNGSEATSEITYADGVVSEIRTVRSTGTITYRYKYGTGNIASVTFAPSVSFGRFFDLGGTSHATLSTRHEFLESFMPGDVPSATP